MYFVVRLCSDFDYELKTYCWIHIQHSRPQSWFIPFKIIGIFAPTAPTALLFAMRHADWSPLLWWTRPTTQVSHRRRVVLSSSSSYLCRILLHWWFVRQIVTQFSQTPTNPHSIYMNIYMSSTQPADNCQSDDNKNTDRVVIFSCRHNSYCFWDSIDWTGVLGGGAGVLSVYVCLCLFHSVWRHSHEWCSLVVCAALVDVCKTPKSNICIHYLISEASVLARPVFRSSSQRQATNWMHTIRETRADIVSRLPKFLHLRLK